MKTRLVSIISVSAIAATLLYSCGSKGEENTNENDTTVTKPVIKEEDFITKSDTASLNGFIAYNSAATEKLPVVLIVHEWWGINDYSKNRAKQLAELGYFAVAMDMYGNAQTAANPEEAGKKAMPFYQNPQEAYNRISATLKNVKSYKNVDTTRIAAIGYCFGGSMVLNAAKMGLPVNGVVSFHGGLAGVTPEKGKTKAAILVCHGAADKFVSAAEVTKFKAQLDSVGTPYTFKEYADATHAFSNPDATENGKKFNIPIAYNEKADKASWQDMKDFFSDVLK